MNNSLPLNVDFVERGGLFSAEPNLKLLQCLSSILLEVGFNYIEKVTVIGVSKHLV